MLTWLSQELHCAGTTFLQHQPEADIAHHRHLADLLMSAAAESAALLELGGLQEKDIRFLAEVRAMQLAKPGAQGSSKAGLARQRGTTSLCTQTPDSVDAASHGLILCSTASHTANGKCTRSYQQHPGEPHGTAQGSVCQTAAQRTLCGQASEPRPHSALEHAHSCGSLASALTAVVDFLVHGVLSMQSCSLQSSYAGSALSFIHAAQAAWPGESYTLSSILDHLSSGPSEDSSTLLSTAISRDQQLTLWSAFMLEREDCILTRFLSCEPCPEDGNIVSMWQPVTAHDCLLQVSLHGQHRLVLPAVGWLQTSSRSFWRRL